MPILEALHAFGRYRDGQLLAQCEARSQRGSRIAALPRAGDDLASDFHFGEGKRAQLGQRQAARSEGVEAQPESHQPQPCEYLEAHPDVFDQASAAYLERQMSRRDIHACGEVLDQVRKFQVAQPVGGHVDREIHGKAGRLPGLRLFERLPDHHSREILDDLVVLRCGDEHGRS